MALTMTRTRTQTALTRLVTLVANVHGELETLGSLMLQYPEHQEVLMRRKTTVEHQRDALYATLRQFDPELDLTVIGTLDNWMKAYGRRGTKTALMRYLASVSGL